VLALSYERNSDCMKEYTFYNTHCPKDRNLCHSQICADALEEFKCCLKHFDIPHAERTLEVPNLPISRWNAMDYNSIWLSIKRALITRKEVCEAKGYYATRECEISDIITTLTPSIAKTPSLESQIQAELDNALKRISEREQEFSHDLQMEDQLGRLNEAKALERRKEELLELEKTLFN